MFTLCARHGSSFSSLAKILNPLTHTLTRECNILTRINWQKTIHISKKTFLLSLFSWSQVQTDNPPHASKKIRVNPRLTQIRSDCVRANTINTSQFEWQVNERELKSYHCYTDVYSSKDEIRCSSVSSAKLRLTSWNWKASASGQSIK